MINIIIVNAIKVQIPYMKLFPKNIKTVYILIPKLKGVATIYGNAVYKKFKVSEST